MAFKKKPNNPFLINGFYGKSYFCDREKEVEIMLDHFKNERNMVIYAWRRLGKSSLIKYFMYLLEEKKQAETLYIDLLGTSTIEGAIRQISKAVYEKYGKTTSGISNTIIELLSKIGAEISFDAVSGQPNVNIGLKTIQKADESLEAIGNFLQNRNKTVLVALDEFQQVQNYSDDTAEAIFRTWVQAFPMIRFVFSGSHRNMMQSMFLEKNRPFYKSAQLMQLGPIDLKKYSIFIKKHFKDLNKSITDEAIEAIYSWSRGQTYCVQLLCNKLFGHFDQVELKDLPFIFNEIIDQESAVFSAYLQLLTHTQWKVMKAIAQAEPLVNPTSKEFINTYQLGAASSVSTALKMLEKTETVIKENNAYYLHDVILARWLQRL